MRTFIAIELPHPVQDNLLKQISALQQKVGKNSVRWVGAHNIHITLKFLGEISQNQVGLLPQIMASLARQTEPFTVEIGGLGAFPNFKQPRVIWIGLGTPKELTTLQQKVEGALAKIGYPPEEKPFSPHLTIGRVSQRITAAELHSLRAALEATIIAQISNLTVDSLHLFKSDLQPAGPVYTRLFTAKFSV